MQTANNKIPVPSPTRLDVRYAARLYGVPALARLWKRFGLSWHQVGQRLGRETLVAQIRSIKHGEVLEPAGKKLDVVFAGMMGGYTHFMAFEVLLALALEARGHRVNFVLCDQAFPICEVKKAGQEGDWSRLCAKCHAFGRRFLKASGFPVTTVSELVASQEGGGDWESIVQAAMLKHYRVGVIEEEDTSMTQRRGMLRTSAAISDAVGRAIVASEPDRVVLTHGIYTTWGPLRCLLNEAGIPVITYDKAKKLGTWNLNWKHESAWWDVSDEWAKVKDVPLTAAQEDQLDRYLESRRDHSKDVLQYNLGAEEGVDAVRKRLRLYPQRTTFVLFTNVLWDAASTDREIVFDDPVSWVLDTIEWFSTRPDLQLVVKIHPAEKVIGTNQPFAWIIRRRFPELPANVRLIEPDEEVNSWSIMKVADLGLVHTSTIGLEMPLSGIPCAVVSRTHYREKGFTIDVSSRDEYFDLIESWDPQSVDRSAIMTISRRYAYLLFERYQIPFPHINEIAYSDVRSLKFNDPSELLTHPVLREIVASIEEQRPFLLPN